MGRRGNNWVPISKARMKEAIRIRGYTQAQLSRILHRDKDNLNKQIRTERMDDELLKEIASTIDVAESYLTGELNITDSKDLFISASERDSEGFIVPTYAEGTEIKTFDNLKEAFSLVGNSLLGLYRLLAVDDYLAGKFASIDKLSLSECDYLIDNLMKILPSIFESIEQKRKEADYAEEK